MVDRPDGVASIRVKLVCDNPHMSALPPPPSPHPANLAVKTSLQVWVQVRIMRIHACRQV